MRLVAYKSTVTMFVLNTLGVIINPSGIVENNVYVIGTLVQVVSALCILQLGEGRNSPFWCLG